MKMLVNRTPTVEADPATLEALQAHCRADADEFGSELQAMARTAAAEIEHFAQIALLAQTIRVDLIDPDMTARVFALPIGPVASDATVSVTIDGAMFEAFELVAGNRPVLVWGAEFLDLTPERITIEYPAGFGETAADIPTDLTQAVLDQTALHFDGRSPMDAKEMTSSPHLARIGARYRGVQA